MRYILTLLFLLPTSTLAQSEEALIGDLQKAYQKEILFLNSYRDEIQKKIKGLDTQTGDRVATARRDLKSLETKYLDIQTRNDLSQKRLSDLETESAEKLDSQQALQGIIEQASFRFGKEEFVDLKLQNQLEKAFEISLSNLNTSDATKIEAGEFFNAEGESQKGEIVSLGLVAKFGLTDNGAYSLHPAGDGHFKIWKSVPIAQVEALKQNSRPDQLTTFLYEDASKAFAPPEEKSVTDIAKAGGPIGAVIIGLGALGFILALVRLRSLKASQGRGKSLKQRLEAALNEGNYSRAEEMAMGERSAVGRLSRKLLSNVQKGRQALEDLAGEVVIRESQSLDRFSSILTVFASIAPLLGLLGTVTGMIATFDTITEFGTGNPKLLSGGISEALVTTMFGLIVAIPTLLVAQVLASWGDKIKGDLEQTAMLIINSLANTPAPAMDPRGVEQHG